MEDHFHPGDGAAHGGHLQQIAPDDFQRVQGGGGQLPQQAVAIGPGVDETADRAASRSQPLGQMASHEPARAGDQGPFAGKLHRLPLSTAVTTAPDRLMVAAPGRIVQ